MSATTAPAPDGSDARRIPAAGFLSGIFLSQIVSEALHLAQPLLLIQLSGSLGYAAFFSSFTTAVHMGGSFVGGWPADRFGARRLLVASALLRAACLAAVPVLWVSGELKLPWVLAAYILDSFVRGLIDTAAHTLPLTLAGGRGPELDRLNSLYELTFDLGSVVGPALLGALMLGGKGFAIHAGIPAGFAVAALAFLAIPPDLPARTGESRPSGLRGTLEGLRLVWKDRGLLVACAGLALLNLYPLRRLVSAFFAKSILKQSAAAGWIGAAFGVGGVAGALLYRRFGGKASAAGWVAAGAAGVLVLAVGWLPGTLPAMLAATFVFAATNVCARLAATRRVQERTPADSAGGVTAAVRCGSNASSVALKAAVGVAFAMGAGPRAAFATVGAGLALMAGVQLALAAFLRAPGEPRRPSEAPLGRA